MLQSLSIHNVVLIDKLALSFDKALSVFTGETGAGKSILLDALSLALGGRADTNLVRHGQDNLSVTAEFTITETHPAYKLLQENELDTDTTLILRRTLTKDGKSKAFINDTPISVGLLKQFGDTLVEIHGQFATHCLLNPNTHLTVLDKYGKLQKDTEECKSFYEEWKNAQNAVNEALKILEKAKDELKKIITEIDRANNVRDVCRDIYHENIAGLLSEEDKCNLENIFMQTTGEYRVYEPQTISNPTSYGKNVKKLWLNP